MPRKRKSNKDLPEEKKVIIELLDKIKSGSVPINESHMSFGTKFTATKKSILKIFLQQSIMEFFHVGGVFEDLVYYILTITSPTFPEQEFAEHLTLH